MKIPNVIVANNTLETTSSQTIIEAAVRALRKQFVYITRDEGKLAAIVVCEAITSLIEAAALERAAQIADNRPDSLHKAEAREIAADIRALKAQP